MRAQEHSPELSERAALRGSALLRPWLPAIVACGLLAAYSSKGGSPAPVIDLSWRDKIDHFCVFALLALLVLQALPKGVKGTRRWLGAFLLVSCFGLCDEAIQHFNPARAGDPLDWFADSLGALLAVVLYTALPMARTLADWSPVLKTHRRI